MRAELLAQARALVERAYDEAVDSLQESSTLGIAEEAGSLRAILASFDSVVSPQAEG